MYRIIRFYFEDDAPSREVVKTGLTLEEAREHCRNPETSSSTESEPSDRTKRWGDWFDGYEEE